MWSIFSFHELWLRHKRYFVQYFSILVAYFYMDCMLYVLSAFPTRWGRITDAALWMLETSFTVLLTCTFLNSTANKYLFCIGRQIHNLYKYVTLASLYKSYVSLAVPLLYLRVGGECIFEILKQILNILLQ